MYCRGVKRMTVYLDGVLVTPASGVIIAKAPGSAGLDFAQFVALEDRPRSGQSGAASWGAAGSTDPGSEAFAIADETRAWLNAMQRPREAMHCLEWATGNPLTLQQVSER